MRMIDLDFESEHYVFIANSECKCFEIKIHKSQNTF